ncbi:MAG: hypothetical protein Q9175_000737 [Cornicularia normoerica]
MARKFASGVKIDSTEDPIVPQDQSQCPLFSAVPVEIRHMIFHHLLTTAESIEKPHKHLGSKETALLDNYKPIPQIDSAILRTCRMIYSEALPILYGQNTFEFSSANAIRSFQSKSLIGYPLAFNLKLAPMGRLTLLRSVIINLNAEYRWHSPIGVNGTRGAPNRDHIWRDWSTTLFSENDDLCPWGGRNGLGFPALEKLTLDFSEWQLTDSEGLLVKPFLMKLGESGGLNELVLKGVKHQPTIDQFRAGLVKEGGTFQVKN